MKLFSRIIFGPLLLFASRYRDVELPRKVKLQAIASLVLNLAFTMLVVFLLIDMIEEKREQHLRDKAMGVIQASELAFNGYAGMLRGTKLFFENSEFVSAGEFNRYVGALLDENLSAPINAVTFNRYSGGRDKQPRNDEERYRDKLLGNHYAYIRDPSPFFFEYDSASANFTSDINKSLIQKIIDNDSMQATIPKARSFSDQDSLLLGMTVPAYKGGQRPATKDRRRELALGTTSLYLRINDVFNDICQSNLSDKILFHLYVKEDGPDNLPVKIYETGTKYKEHQEALEIEVKHSDTIQFSGITFILEFSALRGFLDTTLLEALPLTALVLGILITLLVAREILLNGYLSAANSKLSHIATTDELTKCYNRRHYFHELSDAIARYNRFGESFSLILLDIDHFKQINDNYGHPAGDEVLRRFSDHAKGIIREVDTLYRVGGEEFIVLLPNADKEDGLKVAQRLNRSTDDYAMKYDGQTIELTISAGVIDISETAAEPSALMRLVDKRLYSAKEQGRNRVVATDD